MKLKDVLASPGGKFYARDSARGEKCNTNRFPDPLFFLHHANLDRLWWQWQQRDLNLRLWGMGGRMPSEEAMKLNNFTAISELTLKWDGDPSNVTTLNHILNMGGVVPNRTVSEVMDIRNQLLCYQYT